MFCASAPVTVATSDVSYSSSPSLHDSVTLAPACPSGTLSTTSNTTPSPALTVVEGTVSAKLVDEITNPVSVPLRVDSVSLGITPPTLYSRPVYGPLSFGLLSYAVPWIDST